MHFGIDEVQVTLVLQLGDPGLNGRRFEVGFVEKKLHDLWKQLCGERGESLSVFATGSCLPLCGMGNKMVLGFMLFLTFFRVVDRLIMGVWSSSSSADVSCNVSMFGMAS